MTKGGEGLRMTRGSRSFASLRMTRGGAARCPASLLLLLILDLVGWRRSSRALQVVLHPLHHAQVVVEPVRGQPVPVPFPRIEHQPDRRLPLGFHVPVPDA